MALTNLLATGCINPLEGGIPPCFFQWNPNEVDGPLRDIKYDKIKTAGRIVPIMQYSCGEPVKINFKVVFSRSDFSDSFVHQQVDTLLLMTTPVVKGQGVDRPPRVRLVLGEFMNYTCVVTSVHPKFFQLFTPIALMPLLCECKLTLTMYL